MRTRLDLTGQRFGRLVAVQDVGARRSFRVWRFQCDCGAEVDRTTADVRTGKTSSCGCLQRDLSSERKLLDITGQVFGRLRVVARRGTDGHGHAAWDCSCSCGENVVVSGIVLRKGEVQSCGCLRRELAAERRRAAAMPVDQRLARMRTNAVKQRVRRKTDPLKAMQARLSRLHRHALSRVGAIKTSATFQHLGYTPAEFVAHIERQFVEGMGWGNMNEWQIDHILPVSKAKTVDDVLALNQLANLRPLWAKENNAKKAKVLTLL